MLLCGNNNFIYVDYWTMLLKTGTQYCNEWLGYLAQAKQSFNLTYLSILLIQVSSPLRRLAVIMDISDLDLADFEVLSDVEQLYQFF